MSEDIEQKLDRMGRRRFLNTLAGLGISATTLNYLSQEVLADLAVDWKEEVPYVERLRHSNPEEVRSGSPPKREPIFATIPREKWVQVESAHDAAARVERIIKSKGLGNKFIEAGVTTVISGNHAKKAVLVNYVEWKDNTGKIETPEITYDELNDILPATIAGSIADEVVEDIPVVLRQETRVTEATCKKYWYDSDFDHDIPAGCKFESNSYCVPCTLGTPAYNNGTDERNMVTAAHCIDDNVSKLYQPSCDLHVDGYVEDYLIENNADFGIIHPPTSHEGWELYKYRLADDDGTFKDNRYIEGRLNWSTIKYHEGDTSYVIKRQGIRTGTTSGYITSTNTNNGHPAFWTNCETYDGNSGGPYYKEYESSGTYSVYIAGIHAWGAGGDSCPRDKGGGNAMEHIEDVLNITV